MAKTTDAVERKLMCAKKIAIEIFDEDVSTTFRRMRADKKFKALFRKLGNKTVAFEHEVIAYIEAMPSLTMRKVA
jgi:hypothetical protein